MDTKQKQSAEKEFANVAFEILNKDAITEILKKIDPVAVLNLCQTNTRFASICNDQDVFRQLMKAHYPAFPLADDPKAQYMQIAAGRGTDYYLPILENPEPRGHSGYPGKYATEATVERVDNAIRFTIFGTRIRKGEKLWLLGQVMDGVVLPLAMAFSTREDAIKGIPILSRRESTENYINGRLAEYRQTIVHTPRSGRPKSRNVKMDSPEFLAWLEEKDYPYPLTVEGVRNWVEEYGYIYRSCGRNLGRESSRCADIIIPIIIG